MLALLLVLQPLDLLLLSLLLNMNSKRAKQLKKLAYQVEENKLQNTLQEMGLDVLNLTELQKIELTKQFKLGFKARYKLLKKRYMQLRREGKHYPHLYKKKEAA